MPETSIPTLPGFAELPNIKNYVPAFAARSTRQFPYAVYFSIEDDTILILAVLHTARDPAEWQRRI